MKPLISIIIPIFNRALLIGETLDSVLGQSYENWECIVVDDGSTDNSLNIIQKYCDKDIRFKLFCRPDNRTKGASACRNIGLENAKGDYIQFLDSDDIIAKNKLGAQIGKIYKNSDAIGICKWGIFNNDINTRFIKNDLAYYKDFKSSKDLFDTLGLYGIYIPLHSFLVAKKIIIKSGKWNESLTINDDGEFFSRIILNAKEIFYCNNTYVYYRKNSINSLSSYNNIKKLNSLIFSWKLIERNLKTIYKKEKNHYVENSKRRMFVSLKDKYPIFILRNIFYFYGAIKYYYLKKLNNRLISFLNEL